MIEPGMNSSFRRNAGRAMKAATVFVVLQCAAACSRAPTFNILGSFFPSWILCGVIGVGLAIITRLLFVRIKLEPQLTPLIVVYPSLALFFTFTLWLLFFS
jgi:hypothetical protein